MAMAVMVMIMTVAAAHLGNCSLAKMELPLYTAQSRQHLCIVCATGANELNSYLGWQGR